MAMPPKKKPVPKAKPGAKGKPPVKGAAKKPYPPKKK